VYGNKIKTLGRVHGQNPFGAQEKNETAMAGLFAASRTPGAFYPLLRRTGYPVWSGLSAAIPHATVGSKTTNFFIRIKLLFLYSKQKR